MPELPEVQTVLDTLANRIKNRKIVDIKILYKPIVLENERTFKKLLIGQSFKQFKRRGKYLLFEMNDITLVSHLRMEGKYFILDDKTPINKHDHVIFYLDNGKQLRYNDVRKFGRMEIIDKDDDIDLSTLLNTNATRGATYNGAGCGTGQGFNAYFDGQGHIIKGVNLTSNGNVYLGLFGSIGKDAIIKNLIVDMELGLTGYTNTSGGGLAYNCAGLIENVCVKGVIKGGTSVYNSLFCTTLQASGKIKNCLGVDLSTGGFDKVGLLAGNVATGLSQIENSVAITQAQKVTAGMYNYAVRAIAGSTASPVDATVSSLADYYNGLSTNPFENILSDDGTNITWLGSNIGSK